jgi:CelD/BcsL family acetyltransferase involved in cellulose biosynthesis
MNFWPLIKSTLAPLRIPFINYTNTVYYIVVMKNITVTLDEKTAAWARVYAARHNKSLSRFLGELLHRTMRESREYEEAMQRYFAKKPSRLNRENAPYPAREELYG